MLYQIQIFINNQKYYDVPHDIEKDGDLEVAVGEALREAKKLAGPGPHWGQLIVQVDKK